jgi:hypothetical protein
MPTAFAAQGRSSNISGNSGGSAFWESMAAVYHDEGYLTFYSPIAVPFDPFREGGALFRGSDNNSAGAAGVAAVNVPTLSLRGIAVGGAHTFVYGSLKRQRGVPEGASSGATKEEAEEEGKGQQPEFPETLGNGQRGGWRRWYECPNLGCRSVLPDELADWHRVLCNKLPPPPKLDVLATDASAAAASSGAVSEGLTAAEDAAAGEHRRLPPLRPGGHAGGPTVLEKISAARRKFENGATAAEASPSSLRTKVVKKRVGGGYAYVTVPDLQPDLAAASEAASPRRVLGFE